MKITILSLALVAGCWRGEPEQAAPAPVAKPPAPTTKSARLGDAEMCQLWIARSRPLVDRKSPGAVDWDDIARSCDKVKPEERPFLQCVADAADDPAVERCWDTYFTLDVNPARAIGGH